jgi:Skp family chaperone for outer membrane proteins
LLFLQSDFEKQVASLTNTLCDKEAEITALKVELKDVMTELVEAKESLEAKQQEVESLKQLVQVQPSPAEPTEPHVIREVVEVIKEVSEKALEAFRSVNLCFSCNEVVKDSIISDRRQSLQCIKHISLFTNR